MRHYTSESGGIIDIYVQLEGRKAIRVARQAEHCTEAELQARAERYWTGQDRQKATENAFIAQYDGDKIGFLILFGHQAKRDMKLNKKLSSPDDNILIIVAFRGKNRVFAWQSLSE